MSSKQPLVGQRLRNLREQLGMTRAELSAATGVAASAIARLENGRDVRLPNYLPIIDYFIVKHPKTWMVAERIVLMSPARRSRVLGLAEDPEP